VELNNAFRESCTGRSGNYRAEFLWDLKKVHERENKLNLFNGRRDEYKSYSSLFERSRIVFNLALLKNSWEIHGFFLHKLYEHSPK